MFDDKNSLDGQTDFFCAMQKSLSRRGPDQNGIYIDDPVALIHTRLSVIDPQNGLQPMLLKSGGEEYAIVYNGELYNTQEIRDELKTLGHVFLTRSDTEALLHAYAEWKDKCLGKLNGIFAFAVWEKRAKRLFLARDRIGVKPLFYFFKDGRLLFASEIKAILAHPLATAEIDAEGVAEIMYIGPGRTPGCGVFKGVREIKPAHCAYLENGRLDIRRYFCLTDAEHRDSFETTAEKVRFLVVDAIERQLVSDVPVCTFLSGGLDSSIISSVANSYFKKNGGKLVTFSVDYKDNSLYFNPNKFQPSDDREFIDCMTEYLGAENRRVVLDSEQLADALYDAVDARDLPGMADVDSSLLLFCREIKKHATVALSGECADEIFGGYPWYRDEKIRTRDGFPWAQSTDYRASFVNDDFGKKIDASEYVNARYYAALNSSHILSSASPLEKRMRQMVNLNFDWFMQTLLDRKDRMSMYNGLEVRVPFCDYRIAEYLYSAPWEFKDYLGREKGLLRQAVRGLLPEKVLLRKKSPYPKTHNPGYLKAVSKKLSEIIADPTQPLHQIVKKQALQELIAAQKPSDVARPTASKQQTPWYGQLMTAPQTIAYFLQVNYWLKKYNVKIVER
jgi:asparagine synthase (glutamine-hydrolysing)